MSANRLQFDLRALGWHVRPSVPFAKATQANKVVDYDDFTAVIDNNKLDAELFSYARELFKERFL